MHLVIEHILARRNQTAPTKDGRKIVLVLYGGTMTCIRLVAVLEVLSEYGLTQAFDGVYTISGAFPAASSFLSGQIKKTPRILIDDLSHKQFINLLRFWKMFDSEYLVDFLTEKILNVEQLFASSTKLYVGLHNLDSNKIEYPEIRDFDINDYPGLLEASFSAAYFRPGTVRINGIRYKDLPYRNSTHRNHFKQAFESGATDILVIFNYHRQQGKVFSDGVPENVFCIAPRADWHLSRFETTPARLREQYEIMKNYARSIFLI